MSRIRRAEMWFDPTCPWAWLTSRWLMEVERVRGVEVTWSVMSLSVLNEDREISESYASRMAKAWGPVRVISAAARDHGSVVVKTLYDAMGSRIHPGGNDDYPVVIGEALAEAGLPADLAGYAERADVDDLVRASHERGISLVGQDVGTPIIAVDGMAFFGPVVTPAPVGEAAGRLWDGCLMVAGTPGFFEPKRTRTLAPIFDEQRS